MSVRLFRQQAIDSKARIENGSDPVRRRHLPPFFWLIPTLLFIWALTGFILLFWNPLLP